MSGHNAWPEGPQVPTNLGKLHLGLWLIDADCWVGGPPEGTNGGSQKRRAEEEELLRGW